MNYLKTESAVLFTADKGCSVVINLWNRTQESVRITIVANGAYLNNSDLMPPGAPNEYPDTVWPVNLKEGEKIYGFADKAECVDYEIVQ